MREFKIILWGGFTLIFIGFLSYFLLVFWGLPQMAKNENLDELANFATYQNYFLSFLNLLLVGFISYLVYQSTDKFNKYQMSPILELTVDSDYNWKLINCSNAAARNISLRFGGKVKDIDDFLYSDDGTKLGRNYSPNSESKYTEFTTGWVSCLSVSAGDAILLNWMKYMVWVEVIYSDPLLSEYKKAKYVNLIPVNVETIPNHIVRRINDDRYTIFDTNLHFNSFFENTYLDYTTYFRFVEKNLKE